jgi:hypothetical protein
MKILSALLIFVAVCFYGLWPAYSGYSIKSAFDAADPAALESKVDFPSVRASLRPAVSAEVESVMADLLKKAGPSGDVLLDQARQQALPQIVDTALATLVTPATLIRIYTEGRSLKQGMEAIVRERAGSAEGIGGVRGGIAGTDPAKTAETLGKLGKIAQDMGIDTNKVLSGLLGNKDAAQAPDGVPAHQPVQEAAGGGAKPKYGLGNIKHLGFDGPLAIAIAVARDPAARDSDLTAQMSFVDGDWKLTGLVPRQ